MRQFTFFIGVLGRISSQEIRFIEIAWYGEHSTSRAVGGLRGEEEEFVVGSLTASRCPLGGSTCPADAGTSRDAVDTPRHRPHTQTQYRRSVAPYRVQPERREWQTVELELRRPIGAGCVSTVAHFEALTSTLFLAAYLTSEQIMKVRFSLVYSLRFGLISSGRLSLSSSASDSTFDYWRYINIWLTLTLTLTLDALSAYTFCLVSVFFVVSVICI